MTIEEWYQLIYKDIWNKELRLVFSDWLEDQSELVFANFHRKVVEDNALRTINIQYAVGRTYVEVEYCFSFFLQRKFE